jgi:predicted MFS family arabinose efflux permease
MTARWVPVSKRSSFLARSYMGSTFALILTIPLSRAVTAAMSWEAAFYVVGGTTSVWFLAWTVLVYDAPEEHPRIGRREER